MGTGGNQFYFLLLLIFFRYVVLASIAFLVFYYVKRKTWSFKKIQKQFPAFSDYQREFLYSVSTALIFALLGYAFFFGPLAKYTLVYRDIHAHSIGYFILTIVLTLLLHDAYFYWTHRLMHHHVSLNIFTGFIISPPILHLGRQWRFIPSKLQWSLVSLVLSLLFIRFIHWQLLCSY